MAAAATVLNFAGSNRVGAKIAQATRRPEKVNLTLRLEKNLHARAKTLISRTGANNMQEVIRHGLILYEALVSEAENGKVITVSDPTGEESPYPLFEKE